MTISLPDAVAVRLKGEASRRGLAAEDYAKKLILDHLPPENSSKSLGELFASWQQEDGTEDPAEIELRNQEVEQFKQAMNRNRAEMEGKEARKLFP